VPWGEQISFNEVSVKVSLCKQWSRRRNRGRSSARRDL